jgi:hypothetical protein
MVRYNGAMKDPRPEVWDCEHEIEVNAAPETIWALFCDVPGWTRWNAGIAKIEINGPFEADTEFFMTPPGQEPLVTRLVEVRENAGFVDETQVGELSIFVDHRIEPIEPGRCRVVYSLEAFGPSCGEIGREVAADFPQVLQALATLAESISCSSTCRE